MPSPNRSKVRPKLAYEAIVRALVAERPVVEQVVVVRRPVAAQQRSRVRGRRVPLRRRRSRRSSWGTRTSPRRGPGAGGSSRPGEGPWPRSPAREAGRVRLGPARSAAGRTGPTARPMFSLRLRGHRRVQARVHEHRPGAGMPDQEGGARHGPPLGAGGADAQHLERLKTAPGALEEGAWGVQLAAEQGLDGDRRSLADRREAAPSAASARRGPSSAGQRSGGYAPSSPRCQPRARRSFARDCWRARSAWSRGRARALGERRRSSWRRSAPR